MSIPILSFNSAMILLSFFLMTQQVSQKESSFLFSPTNNSSSITIHTTLLPYWKSILTISIFTTIILLSIFQISAI